MKKLSKYLESIGQELHETAYVDGKGVNCPITKDETLAREIWKRALGWVETIENEDKTFSHRVFKPDPRAQQFIFERREGKPEAPIEGQDTSLLDDFGGIARDMMNKSAEEIVTNGNTDNTETDAQDPVS